LLLELLSDGQGRDNVSAGAAACDDDAHGFQRLKALERVSHGGNAKAMPLLRAHRPQVNRDKAPNVTGDLPPI